MTPDDPDRMSVQELMAPMAGLSLFLVENRLADTQGDLGSHLKEHLLYMIELEKRGALVLSGPLYDESGAMTGGGISVLRAESFEAARRMAEADPFFRAGLREFSLRRWVVNEGRLQVTIDLSDCSSAIR